jgi:hypothetical protein
VIAQLLLLGAIIAVVLVAELVGLYLDARAERRQERDFLERTARNYGLEPRPRESNEALRLRLREHLQPRRGWSLPGMIAVAGDVPGVLRVFVVNDGPGRLSMYVEPNDPDVVDRVRAAVLPQVALGVVLNIQGAGADDAA